MKISNPLLYSLVASMGLAVATSCYAEGTTKEALEKARDAAAAHYKADKAACAGMSGNARDVCMEEAKGKEKVAMAEANAAYRNTPKAREASRLARADATYAVAKEKCDDFSGNEKDVCVKEAKAAYTRAKADAKVDRVSEDTRNDSAERLSAARREASEDKRDADYKVAVEKCDALAGAAKDACVRDAKMRFSKS